MPTITLDFINEAADERFGPLVIEGVDGGPVTLLNPIRLSKDKRKALQDMQTDATDDVDAALDGLRAMVKLVAKTPSDATRLLKAFGDDQAKLAVLLQEYGQASRVGEASPSPS